jgi:chromosome segregation ATPase
MNMQRDPKPARRLALALAALWAGAWAPLAAPEPKNQDAAVQQVLKKAQGVVRQLTEEKARLETQKATLEQEKAALEQQKTALEARYAALQTEQKSLEERARKLETALRPLQPLPAELQRCKAGVESLREAGRKLQEELAEARSRETGLQRQARENLAFAGQVKEDNSLLIEAVKEREQWIAQCGQRNHDLRATGRRVVEQYRDKSFWEEAANLEPFTGIGKVQRENTAEEFRYRIEHLKTTPFQGQVQAPPGGWDAAKAVEPDAAPAAGTAPEEGRP